MKDFIKIFLVLCATVGAFLFGRNHGEENFRQSQVYRSFIKAKDEQSFTRNDLENLRTKFQNILDASENKKSEQILEQVLQVLTADLGLKIKNPLTFTKQDQSAPVSAIRTVAEQPKAEKKQKGYNYKKIKSYEWILKNSRDSAELKANLKNVEIKDIDSFLKDATEPKATQLEPIYGSYRGRIMDVTHQEYATLSFDMGVIPEAQPTKIKGSIKIFRNAKETSVRNFAGTELGFKVEGSSSFIIDNGNTYYQVYKIPDSQQIAGYYYERLVNGTTKTIGSFVLNRVDQF